MLLAKEKVDKLVAIAPRDKNVQALLVSINESIEEEGLHLINNEQEEAAEVEEETIVASEASGSLLKLVKNDVSGKKLLPAHEVSPGYLEQKENVKDLMLVANSQIAIGDLAGAISTLMEIEARDPNSKEAKLLSIKLSRTLVMYKV